MVHSRTLFTRLPRRLPRVAGGEPMPLELARLARVEWVAGAGGGGEGWMSRSELRDAYAARCRCASVTASCLISVSALRDLRLLALRADEFARR
jgi:hypothetical protein